MSDVTIAVIDPVMAYRKARAASSDDILLDGSENVVGGPLYHVVTIDDTDSPYDAKYEHLILCDATNGAIIVNVPTAVNNSGKSLNVKKMDNSSNSVTLDGNSAETIDGELTQVLTAQHDSITVVSTGTELVII